MRRTDHRPIVNPSAVTAYKKLTTGDRPRAGLVHGQCCENRRSHVRPSEGKIDVLVCTTVVEVSMSNATVMIIEGAEIPDWLNRINCGRVGRGQYQSYHRCSVTDDAAGRTTPQNILQYPDGFKIAEQDIPCAGLVSFSTTPVGLRSLSLLTFRRFRLDEERRR